MRKFLCLLVLLLLIPPGCNVEQTGCETVEELPSVGSEDNLRRLVKERKVYGMGGMGLATEAAMGNSPPSHSTTNLQVTGVDEADIVKTDGEYLYHIAGPKVLITLAHPASSMRVVREIEHDGFTPTTLYLDDCYLIVIGLQQEMEGEDWGERFLLPGWSTSTRVMAYDINDPEKLTLSRDISLDGFTITSRKQGKFIYLVNSRYVGWLDGEEDILRPWYSDALTGGEKKYIKYKDIHYFPQGELSDYLLMATLDLDTGDVNVETYLGWAQNVYMSRDNLYVAAYDGSNTSVYKFSAGDSLDYQGKGEVSGYPLNQFAMDEHGGYFRIATTVDEEGEELGSNVYILDSRMSMVGAIRNIAPGERIFSARFMGDTGYLVTFETVDPLFVMDLGDPGAPKITGELKIPGFSNYLHPLDDWSLLGIGQDTQVGSMEGIEFVVPKGLKLAIFDVGDANNPRERHVQTVGGSGTWSDALYDHRAVFYHEGVLAFCAGIAGGKEEEFQFLFHGALFFDVDVDKGFKEIGRITHITGDAECAWFEQPFSAIKRVVQIDDVYYTLSDSAVMAHSKSFKLLSRLELPALDSDLLP